MSKECDLMIQKVADMKASTAFNKNYVTDENLRDRQVEGLGMAIASWADWSGSTIMEVFKSALEDANFHSESEMVGEMIEKLFEKNPSW